jgi:hypothetical protein
MNNEPIATNKNIEAAKWFTVRHKSHQTTLIAPRSELAIVRASLVIFLRQGWMVCSQGIEFRHFLVIKVKPPGLVAHDTSVRSIFYPGNDNLIQGTFEGFTLQGHIFVHNTPHLIALGAASGGHKITLI